MQIQDAHFPDGALSQACPLGRLEMTREREGRDVFAWLPSPSSTIEASGQPALLIRRATDEGAEISIFVRLAAELDAVDVSYRGEHLPRTDSRLHAALHTNLGTALPEYELIHDHPFGLSTIDPQGEYWRKYPTGDWMTSPQVYEKVHNPFTALQLLDFCRGGARAPVRARRQPGALA